MPHNVTLASLWDDTHAATLDEAGRLLYRSNLLGSDLRITNFGGGNTSAKIADRDPLSGEPVTVLWVKGSGGDIGSMKRLRHVRKRLCAIAGDVPAGFVRRKGQ